MRFFFKAGSAVRRGRSPLRPVCAALLCCLLWFFPQARAADASEADQDVVPFDHYTQYQGLSSNSVQRLLQDRRGFVWVGTNDGLNRFDGYRFKVFRHDEADLGSISDNWIHSLCEDSRGNLWVGTSAGLDRYNRRTGTFEHFPHDTTGSGDKVVNRVNSILEDRSGRLWIGTEMGVYRLDPVTRRFTGFRCDLGRSFGSAEQHAGLLAEGPDGKLWVSSRRGLVRFDPASGRYTFFDFGTTRDGSPRRVVVSAIRPAGGGGFWVATDGGLFRFDPALGRYTPFPLVVPGLAADPNDSSLNDLVETPADGLWVASRGGLYQVGTDGRVRLHRSDPASSHGLNHRIVSCLLIDRSGVLWAGTYGGGLNLMAADRFRFRAWPFLPDSPRSPADWTVWSFAEDGEGKLWVGTQGGLNRFDPANGIFEVWRHVEGDPRSLADSDVRSVLPAEGGCVWVATRQGVNLLHPRRGVLKWFHRVGPDPRGLSDNFVRCLFRDSRQRIWLGTNNGLNRMDNAVKGVFRNWQPAGSTPERLLFEVRTIVEDARRPEILWLGTSQGLFRFDTTTETLDRVEWIRDGRRSNAIREYVFSILQVPGDPTDDLWLGVRGQGLLRVNRRTGACRAVTTRDGLPSDDVYGLLSDGQGGLWLGTNNGLCHYVPAAGAIQIFDATDGLPCSEFNAGACFRSSDGRLYFGGINGYLGFFPRVPSLRSVAPPVAITGFEAQGMPVAVAGDISEREEIELPWNLPSFTLSFAALDFSTPRRNRYAYRLEGAHDEWVPCGAHREVTFANLPPGVYTFRVKGCNPAGAWNQEGAALRIVIPPPFWRTRWAYALYALAGGVLLAAGLAWWVRARTAALHRRFLEENVRRLKELDELKTGFLSVVSHDLRTPITSIVGFAHLLRQKFVDRIRPALPEEQNTQRVAEVIVRNAEIIESEGKRLVGIINDLLDLTKLESGRIQLVPEAVDIPTLLARAGEVTAILMQERKLAWRLETEENLPPVWCDRDRIMQVVVNLVSNAVKFTEAGGVTVSARREGAEVAVAVADTGSGIPENELDRIFDKFHQVEGQRSTFLKGTGLGLPICRELVELHGGRIRVESRVGEGSVFRFTLPVAP